MHGAPLHAYGWQVKSVTFFGIDDIYNIYVCILYIHNAYDRYIIQGVPKKTGPAYVFSHPDYNFIPMKVRF